MATIPGFWEGGPHDSVDAEDTWREFVGSAGGLLVEELIHEPREFENADFLFPSIPVVAELKEVDTEFDRSTAFRTGFLSLIDRVIKEDPGWRPSLVGGCGAYPKWFSREFVRLFRPQISRVLKKANRQIRETKTHFGIRAPTGMLVFVNDGFTALEPHFIRALACDLLTHSFSSIDCFLYMTVNRYVKVAGSDIPRLLWIPSYSDRAPNSLVNFVDDLGRKWYDFLESKIGPFSANREEIPQGSGSNTPLISRAILLPGEKR